MMTDTDAIQFDADFASPAEWAAMYRLRGIQIVPARFPMKTKDDKRPALADWKTVQNEQVNDAVFEKWFGHDQVKPNMGFVTGACSGNVICIDLDDYKTSDAARWMIEALDGITPHTWMQTTGGGGRQYFFRLPEGVSISNCCTALGVDIRAQGGFAMVPPSWHYSGKQYEWVKDHEPWSIKVETIPPQLLDAIKALIEEHGGSSVSSATIERTQSVGTDFDAFGSRVDGREDYMTRLVWGAVVDWHRECPIPPPNAEVQAKMREAYGVYERSVKSRLPDDGTSKGSRLEREGRGATLFTEKWQNAMRQWNDKVADHAAHIPDGKSVYQAASAGTVSFDPETGEVIGETPRPKSKIEFIPWDDLPDLQVQWLIKDFLPAGGFAALYGKPGSYKSFVALYLAASIASGRTAFDRATTQGDVIYIAGEGGAGLKKRRDAFNRFYDMAPGTRVHFIRAQLNFRSTFEDAQAVIEGCQALNIQPSLIIIDTLARAFAGGNENASEDMGAFIGVTGRLQEALGHPAILIVHHSGKDEARGMRGHSSLFGAVDTELEVVKVSADESPDRIGKMTVTKQKDGEDGFALTYRLEHVSLSDIDPDKGSLVVVPDEEVASQRQKKPISANARQALRALEAAIAEHGEAIGLNQIPRSARCVKQSLWREFFYAMSVQDGETRRKTFLRASNALVESGTVGAWADWCWISNA